MDETMKVIDERKISRAEVSLSPDMLTNEFKKILQSNDFHVSEEVIHMRARLSQLKDKITIEDVDITKKDLFSFSKEELYSSWYVSYQESQNRCFLDRNEEQRRSFFNDLFDESDPYLEEATIALVQNSTIIGFSIVRPTHGENNGHLWILGVHPEYRRRGYATNLMSNAVDVIERLGMTTMSLNVDSINEVAYKLYASLGFHEDWRRIYYAWTNK
jgi:ribosomal protein S18 acetylase RimI-like enzyme